MALMTADAARKLSYPNLLPAMPFWGPDRTDAFRAVMGGIDEDGTAHTLIPRLNGEWNRVLTAPSSYTPVGPINPFSIPSNYQDEDSYAAALTIVDPDTNTAVDLALRWHVLGDEAAAAGAVRILDAWSTITAWDTVSGATTMIVWARSAPRLIQAAFLLQSYPGFTTAKQDALKAMFTRSRAAGATPSSTYQNNIGVWGVVLDFATAKLLNDRVIFNRALYLWRQLFDTTIVDNVPVNEVRRQGASQGNGSTGLWYSNFTLYAFTVAAEWARYGGEWLYDHTGPDGSTFRGLAEQVRYWTRYPALFPYNTSGTPSTTSRSLPHDEILHALWPDENSAWILNQFPDVNSRDSFGLRGAALIYRGRPLYG